MPASFFASDAPLPEVFPPPEYDYLAINVDDGTIDDGGADDNFALRTYPDSFLYTDKAFAVCLDWAYYTEGRAAADRLHWLCPRIRALRGTLARLAGRLLLVRGASRRSPRCCAIR